MSLPALRQQLAAILAPPRVGGAAAIPTGIEALDRALSDGGVPSGRLTEIQGARGSGRTTLVRQLVTTAVAARRWVAIVDGSRTLAPREWAEAGDSGRLWVIRPPAAVQSAWCADILLRSSAFSLVVLDSAPALPRPVAIRLTRLAQEHDVALVVVGDHPVIGSAVRLRVKRTKSEVRGQRIASQAPGPRPQALSHESPVRQSHITIHVDKGGLQHAVEVFCAIEMARRLRTHSEVPDRRGVATRNRRGEKVASPHRRESGARAAPHEGERESERENEQPPVGTTLPRKRRFAEAWSRRDGFLFREGGQKAEARKERKAKA
jgi:RecA DNA recombination protein